MGKIVFNDEPNCWFQKDETSSIANKRPPMGAPNAEETPAATPAEIKSRLSLKLRKCLKNGIENQKLFDCVTACPTNAPIAIIGPSGPTKKHEALSTKNHQ